MVNTSTISDTASLQQTTSNLAAIAQNSRDIPPAGQKNVAQVVDILSAGLENVSSFLSQDETIDIGKELSLASLSILEVGWMA